MNKKGFEMTVTRAIIIAIIVVLILMFWVGNLGAFMKRNAEDTICKSTVRTHVNTQVRNNVVFANFKCPTRHFTIKEDVNDDNMGDIKDIIAREMYSCCDNFGQCYTEEHPPWNLFDTSLRETKYCILCSVFDFKDKGKEVDNVIQYLIDTPVPVQKDKEPISYFTAFTNLEPTPEIIQKVKSTNADKLYTDAYYAVFLGYAKDGSLNKITGKFAVIGTMLVGAVLLIAPIPGSRVGAVIVLSSLAGGAGGGAYMGATRFGGISNDVERNIFLMPYTQENVDNLDCEKLPIPQDANT